MLQPNLSLDTFPHLHTSIRVSTELCCFCSQGRKALDSRQLSCTKTVTGERLEDPKQWSRLGEDRDSAEGKTKFFSDRREQGENIPRCHANPEGQQEARGVGAALQRKAAAFSLLTTPPGPTVQVAEAARWA